MYNHNIGEKHFKEIKVTFYCDMNTKFGQPELWNEKFTLY